jgi:serine/threonine protein kinase
MGAVYRARDTALRRDVAVKVLTSIASPNPERLRRFQQEAQAAAALNHPNILSVFQLGSYEGTPYLVSELLEGRTLREALARGPLPTRNALDFGVQIAKGLAAAHEKGITHRDLKPENLFITKDGRVKILDFGLAKLKHGALEEGDDTATITVDTEPGVVMGTTGYMSPEQVRGQVVDHRTDIFAFGAVLYEMLTGNLAFRKATPAETMSAILIEDPGRASQFLAGAHPGLQRVVERCLEKNPEQRFQSASDLAFALETLSGAGSASHVAVSSQKSRKWSATAGLLVALGIGLAVWWFRPAASPAVEAVKQLTSDGEPKNGNLETDGTRVYFNEGAAGSSKVAQVSVNGGQTATVPSNLENASLLALSGDGSALLLLVQGFNAPQGALWSLALPASQARRLGETEATDASLFPDGRLLYTLGTRLYIATSDGSNPRELLDLVSYVSVKPRVLPGDKRLVAFPKASPDSTKIVFNTLDANNQLGTIFEMASDGTNVHQLLKGESQNLPREICCAKWTPNGRYLVFQGKSEERWDVWIVRYGNRLLRGSARPVQLTNGPLSYSLGSFGRDGKEIFVIGTQRRGELVRYNSESREFIPYMGGMSVLAPSFSRDGKWIAYQAYPDYTIWRSRADGSDRLQLTYAPMEAIFPRISPDGTKVAFSSPDGILYVVGINGGAPQKLSDNAWGPAWSPDAHWLAFTSVISGKKFGEKGFYQTRVLGLQDGDISVIPDSEDTVGTQFVVGDGLVAAAAGTAISKIMFFNLKKKEWSVLATTEKTFVNWAPSLDGKYLYCTTGGNDPKALRIRISDRAVEPIAGLKDLRRVDAPFVTTYLSVAPDGSMLFTRDIGTQEIYALTVKWP